MEPCGDDLTPSTARIVFVEWEDIQSHEDWNDESEGNTTCTLKSLGWLIEDDDRKLVVAMTYDYENERWANKFAIGKKPPVVTRLTVMEESAEFADRKERMISHAIDVIQGAGTTFRHVPRSTDPFETPYGVVCHPEIPGQP